jgi:hypothetical protein
MPVTPSIRYPEAAFLHDQDPKQTLCPRLRAQRLKRR